MIEHPIVVANGSTVAIHVIKELNCAYPLTMFNVVVDSYATEAAFVAGSTVAWQDTYRIPVVELDLGALLPSIELWLTQVIDSPLYGGYVMQDGRESLDTLKARKWTEIKAARLNAEKGSFEFQGLVFQANEAKITSAALSAVMSKTTGVQYVEDWTLLDNSVVKLDADYLIALGLTYTAFTSRIHARGRQLRKLIFEQASTSEEVAAIRWHTWVEGDTPTYVPPPYVPPPDLVP